MCAPPGYTAASSRAAAEFFGTGDRQVTHPAAAHVGGVGAADPVAAGQQLRRIHRTADDDRPAGREPAGAASSANPGRRRRRRSAAARAPPLRRPPASDRPNAAPGPAAECARNASAGRRVAFRGSPPARCAAVSSASAIGRRARRGRAVDTDRPAATPAARRRRRCRTSAPAGRGRRSAPPRYRAGRSRRAARRSSPVSW